MRAGKKVFFYEKLNLTGLIHQHQLKHQPKQNENGKVFTQRTML
ncbi:MAG: hypothetical protein WBA93_28760 [Microcoleaceae cyanobacterium]